MSLAHESGTEYKRVLLIGTVNILGNFSRAINILTLTLKKNNEEKLISFRV